MKIIPAVFLSLVAMALLAGCASKDFADIQADGVSDPTVNVGEYKTYAWRAAAAVVRDPGGNWTPSNLDIGSEIVSLVDREMAKQGLVQVVDQPELHLIYAVGVDMENIDVVVDEESDADTLKNVPRGGLLVIAADPATREVVWVGGASGEVQDNPSAELVKKRLDYAITKMFMDYPDGN